MDARELRLAGVGVSGGRNVRFLDRTAIYRHISRNAVLGGSTPVGVEDSVSTVGRQPHRILPSVPMGVTASLQSFRSTAGLFDDVAAQRALTYLEPILARTARVGHHQALFEWANRVYLVHKLLRDRRHALATTPKRREWRRMLHAVTELVHGAADTPEQPYVIALVSALDGERGVQPATPQWLAARASYAGWLEGEGHHGEALALYALTTGPGWATLPTDAMLETVLATARLYRRLARWDSSQRAYERAGELADSIDHREGRIRSRLGVGLVAMDRGNYPAAIATLTELYQHAAGASRNLRARIAHDLFAALERSGQAVDALVYGLKALDLYEGEEDRLAVFGGIGNLVGSLGLWETALMVHTCIRARTSKGAIRMNAAIDSLPAIVRLRPEDFAVRAEAILAQLEGMAPSMRIDCRYQAALGYRRLGMTARAHALLQGALVDAADYELNHWYFRIETALKSVGSTPSDMPPAAPSSHAAFRSDARLAPLLAGVEGAAHRFATAV